MDNKRNRDIHRTHFWSENKASGLSQSPTHMPCNKKPPPRGSETGVNFVTITNITKYSRFEGGQ